MVTIFTAPYHGYQVLFSPFACNKIAFTGAVNYGISGKSIPHLHVHFGKFIWTLLSARLAGNGVLLIYERDEVGYKEFRRSVNDRAFIGARQ